MDALGKFTDIIRARDTQLFCNINDLPHKQGIIFLAEKVYITLINQNNCLERHTTTQWNSRKELLPLKAWDNISHLYTYPGTTVDTRANTDITNKKK